MSYRNAALTVLMVLVLIACSSNRVAAPQDAALVSCGASSDCPLDGEVCTYQAVKNGCSLEGQCRYIETPANVSGCSPSTFVCPCSGGTQQVPPCWNGYSPVAVLSLGACDGG